VTRKSITTSHAAVACDVCGRTLLRGENADVFLVGGARRMVCELCTARATHEGWIREGMDLGPTRRAGDGRRRSLFGRLRGTRRENGHEPLPRRGGESLVDEGPDGEPAALQRPPAPATPAFEPPREPRHVHAVPTNAELKMSRAIEVFNGSEHPRTVSGVARSLGGPLVAVRPSATEGNVVAITVAWELSWYRYEVDLSDEAGGARRTEQGAELDELDAADRLANASADTAGRLRLGA
jgi:hypothetical protein